MVGAVRLCDFGLLNPTAGAPAARPVSQKRRRLSSTYRITTPC